jgi:hypothetical protein
VFLHYFLLLFLAKLKKVNDKRIDPVGNATVEGDVHEMQVIGVHTLFWAAVVFVIVPGAVANLPFLYN